MFLVHGPYLRMPLRTWLLQLGDATRGLVYMHNKGLVHGNLKGVHSQTP